MECPTLDDADRQVVSVRLDQIEEHVQCRLVGRVHQFHLDLQEGGLVLRGHAMTYYAKQLAQHAVMAATSLPIQANEIEVV